MPFTAYREFFSAYRPRILSCDGRTRAAVLCPLLKDRDRKIKMLLIKRSQTVGSHKGEISFPGGVHESSDPSLEATCLRETEEEIGIQPETITILGRLDEVKTVTGYLVTPFLGVIKWPQSLLLSQNEVDEVIIIDLETLRNRSNQIEFYYFNGRTLQPQIAYRCPKHVIWGATARIITRFLELPHGDGIYCTGIKKSELHLAC